MCCAYGVVLGRVYLVVRGGATFTGTRDVSRTNVAVHVIVDNKNHELHG